MRRSAVLALLGLGAVLLVLFPGLWRALAKRLRVFLVIVSGLTLAAGVTTLASTRFGTLTTPERVLTAAGVGLLGFAWVAVARTALRD